MNESITLRRLELSDASVISHAFSTIGWYKPESQYVRYFQEQTREERIVLVALVAGTFAGYVTIVWQPGYPYFKTHNIPEIQDLNVLPDYRRRGIATSLMDKAEAIIAERSSVVGIGVGLHPGYNAAQRMYVLRGYVPDALGVSYKDEYVKEGDQVTLDDDLILHLTKDIGSIR